MSLSRRSADLDDVVQNVAERFTRKWNDGHVVDAAPASAKLAGLRSGATLSPVEGHLAASPVGVGAVETATVALEGPRYRSDPCDFTDIAHACSKLYNMRTRDQLTVAPTRRLAQELEVLDSSSADLPELKQFGSSLIKLWYKIETSRTDVLRELAKVVVHTRSKFQDETGLPDWAGRTWDYRVFIGEMYSEAGVPVDSQDGVQAALRYHVGNLLREIAPPGELEQLGLKALPPRARGKATDDLKSVLRQTRRIRDLKFSSGREAEQAVVELEAAISHLEELLTRARDVTKPHQPGDLLR